MRAPTPVDLADLALPCEKPGLLQGPSAGLAQGDGAGASTLFVEPPGERGDGGEAAAEGHGSGPEEAWEPLLSSPLSSPQLSEGSAAADEEEMEEAEAEAAEAEAAGAGAAEATGAGAAVRRSRWLGGRKRTREEPSSGCAGEGVEALHRRRGGAYAPCCFPGCTLRNTARGLPHNGLCRFAHAAGTAPAPTSPAAP